MKSSDILSADSWKLLLAAFGTHVDDVWVCWKSNMAGKRVRELVEGDLPETEDCYYCPALLKEGATARKNRNAERVMVMVIDDVGTKINREGFELFAPEPSYWMESSPGNFQAGYVIDGGVEPSTYAMLRRSMKANAIWGHADGCDAVHLFRLPQGVNTKDAVRGWKVVLA